MEEELKLHGIAAISTRTTNTFVPLRDRAALANTSDAAVFVSVHCNSAVDKSANGTEVYHDVGSRPGTFLARAIHRPLVEATGLRDRGVKSARFYVLRNTKMPAVLVELAFISNNREEKLLRDDEFLAKAAKAIAGGITHYVGQI